MELVDLINQVGFPIFACLYLGKTNQKILDTIDKRLELIEVRLGNLENKGVV